MTKKIRTYQTTITTDEHGQIKKEKLLHSYNLRTEDDYIKIYIKHINYIRDLPQGMESVIYELMKCMNYGNKIVVNSHIKRSIAKNTKKTFNTINQYITKLVSSKILIREGRGVYFLNPLFYGKGKWKEIIELREKLELVIQYQDGEYSIKHK